MKGPQRPLSSLVGPDAFGNLSVRLLADLLEFVESEKDGTREIDAAGVDDPARFVLVVAGDVTVERPAEPLRVVPQGGALVSEGTFRVRAHGNDRATVLLGTQPLIDRAAAASFQLAAHFGLRERALNTPDHRPAELVWLAERAGLGAPLEALAELLGASIAREVEALNPKDKREFEEVTAVVTCGASPRIRVWAGTGFADAGAFDNTNLGSVMTALENARRTEFFRILFLAPETPAAAPDWLRAIGVHRVVYLTDEDQAPVPPVLRALLRADARNGGDAGPRFCSFIPSVLIGAPGHLPHDPVTRPMSDRRREAVIDRPRRDACRLRLDLAAVARRFAALTGATAEDRAAFAPRLLDESASLATTMSRWGRAATNRRMGLALSGGGASAYRFIPLLRRLDAARIPIDVVSSVSGGTLLAAYYAREGIPGLQRFVDMAIRYQVTGLASILASLATKVVVDLDMARTRLEDLEMRLVPLTTVHGESGGPQGHAIVAGTLGDAVRLSGSAPFLIGPTEYGHGGEVRRYVDGATAALLPARALHEFGADLVIGANCVAGPSSCNPFGTSWPARLAYRAPVIGRVIDAWVSAAFFLEQAAGEVADDCHETIDQPPDGAPILESLCYADAQAIIERAEHGEAGKQLDAKVARIDLRWRDLHSRVRRSY